MLEITTEAGEYGVELLRDGRHERIRRGRRLVPDVCRAMAGLDLDVWCHTCWTAAHSHGSRGFGEPLHGQKSNVRKIEIREPLQR